MKLIHSLIFVFFLTGTIFAQDAENWVKETSDRMAKAMVSGEDNDWMMSLYADDVYSLPSYEPMMMGKESILEGYKKMQESGFKFNSVNFETVKVMESGDYAYEIGKYKMNMTVPGMEQAIDDNGKYLTVWKKTDDGWKIAVETWNSDINPWATMMMDGEGGEN